MGAQLETILKEIGEGRTSPVYLVAGDLIAAEPRAARLAKAAAEKAGCEVETYRRPTDLAGLFADLRTFSLFASAKVVLAVDTAVLADTKAAAELVDQAAEALPFEASPELSQQHREAASRLMQALRVFGIDPDSGDAAELLDSLPKWALQGGTRLRKKKPRGRGAKEIASLRAGLAELLEAGRAASLRGFARGDLAELGRLVQGTMPEGHCLILAEHSVAADHPVVESLRARGALIRVSRVEADRKGVWQGLDDLLSELERETGVGIERDAVQELARRTLRGTGNFRDKSADSTSTAKLAGEYRKLANAARGRSSGSSSPRIDRELVGTTVRDRGEEDVWQILDAIGQGRGGEALARYRRLIEGADDAMATRLSFFSLLASFCRQLVAVAGMARLERVPPGISNYSQFKNRWAPKLQAEPPQGGKNPLAGLHPFRLHRAYLTASRIDRDELPRLPWRVLETEMQIKGEVSDADAAVAMLISHLVSSRI